LSYGRSVPTIVKNFRRRKSNFGALTPRPALLALRRMAKKFSRIVKIVSGKHTGEENEFSRLEKFAHFWTLVGQSFVRNRCPIRAAALSYTTLLALIPLLAVAISVTSSLLKNQGEDQIEQFVQKVVNQMIPPATIETNSPEENLNSFTATNSISETNFVSGTNAIPVGENERILTAQKKAAIQIHGFIKNIRSGTLGTISMLALVYVAIRLLASIEATFNDIWGITRGRSWLWRIVLYWTAITLGPLLLVGALGLSSSSHFGVIKQFVERTPLIGSLIFKLVPLIVLWFTFALIYLLVPNTKVKFHAAFIGGIVGATLWHLNNVFGFLYATRVVTYSKMYGSLGLVPVFMVGLYLSWLILLFGSQVAYAIQNRASYLQDKLVENVNQRGKEFIALRILTLIGQKFQRGEPPATLAQISAEIGIPSKLAQQILQPLLAARIVTEIAGAEAAFTPTRPLDDINAHHILRALRGQGQQTATRDEPVRAEVLGEFGKIEEAEREAATKITLLALVNRAQKQIEDAVAKTEK
jgi:membrane protein